MKKYILNLLPDRTETHQKKLSNEVSELAVLIGLYNQEQPTNEFTNWLINNLSDQHFVFYPIGSGTTHDGTPHTYNVHFKDGGRVVGSIKVQDASDINEIKEKLQIAANAWDKMLDEQKHKIQVIPLDLALTLLNRFK